MTSPNRRHAHVIGLGLIGASVALALKETGWIVTGVDSDEFTVTAALGSEVIWDTEPSRDVDLVVIATPAGRVAQLAIEALATLKNPDLVDRRRRREGLDRRPSPRPTVFGGSPHGRFGVARACGRAR